MVVGAMVLGVGLGRRQSNYVHDTHAECVAARSGWSAHLDNGLPTDWIKLHLMET